MDKRKLFTLISVFLLFVLSFSLSLKPALAQVGKGFTVIPPRFELFANPGETIHEKIRIKNEFAEPATYAVIVEDFSTAGEEGHVVLEEESNDRAYSLGDWLSLSTDTLTLSPNEEVTYAYSIVVPKDAEPGGHYASILFSSGTTEPVPGAATVNQRIGSLILLRVSGNVDENAKIETFTVPSYSQFTPITFTLRVNNGGNVHIQPKGTIVITNIFGKKVDEIPLNGANVLPNATRKMETVWDKKSVVGTFTATLVATYGQQNLPLTAAARFTVISTTAAIILGVGVLGAIFFLLSLFTGRRRLGKAIRVLTSGK